MLALLLWLLVCVPPHIASKWLRGRSPWPYRFLRTAARICGARVRAVGPKPHPHSLLIANHLSWLDIPVLTATTGCAFVSKDSLGHGLLHWLADQHRTIYVDRNARRSSGEQADRIRSALVERRQPVALFPEGTTGPGDALLPFRSSLLAAVAPPADEVSVQPVAIDYGLTAPELAWFEEGGFANVVRILGRRGSFQVTVRLLERLPHVDDRKALAALAAKRIAASLAASSSNSHPL